MAAVALTAIGRRQLRKLVLFEHLQNLGQRSLWSAVGLYAVVNRYKRTRKGPAINLNASLQQLGYNFRRKFSSKD